MGSGVGTPPAGRLTPAVLLGRFGFYATFAVAVTASVQLVGVYLVFTSLIVPALGTVALAGRQRLLAAFALGVGGYAGGLVLSALFDLPSGPTIVCALVVAALLVASLSRRSLSGRGVPASGSAAGRQL